MSKNTWKHAGLAAAAGLAVMASGCAEEREPINWVQPDALDKSFFVGKDLLDPNDDPEFYTQGTLVDVGFGAMQGGLFTSTYAQPVSRIKWVIQEKELIGRLTYERIQGTDGKGVGAASDDGIIVVVYPIEKHFDIQKQYNPSTGEPSNVIVENTTDRPWYERQFMRVDWSQNRNTDSYDFDTLSAMGIYDGVKYEPLKYYINDPTHPDAPHFNLAEGYFDVTNKAFARPQMVDLSRLGWGIKEFPSCFLPPEIGGGSEPVGNCNPVELTIRQSFRRVEPTDYEPMDWDGHRFQAYGAFYQERRGYARNYGMTDNLWRRFISRYNLWERSHYYADPENMTGAIECYTPETTPAGKDPQRDEDGDGTHDECKAAGSGSRCDIFNQKCTLPYRERTVRPMTWYYTQGNNQEFFDGTQWATDEWDVALRMAVQTARYAECIKTGGSSEECSARYPITTGQQVENEDAVNLTREVLACQSGKAYAGQNCHQVANDVAAARGYSPGVLAVAKMDPVVVLCHSPVEANDPAACGDNRLPEGITAVQCADARRGDAIWSTCQNARQARRGDLRYHQITVIKEPQTPSPWGIMVDSTDPMTGEKIAASANVWSHVTDIWSQGVVEVARYIRGELTTADVTEGTYVEDYSKLVEAAGGYGALGRIESDSQNKILASVAGTTPSRLEALRASGIQEEPRFQASAERLFQKLSDVRASNQATSAFKTVYENRRQRAIGSNIEAQLVTPAMQQLVGSDKLPADLALDYASPLRNGNLLAGKSFNNLREMALAERGACVLNEAPAPVAMTGLVEILEEKFGAFNPNDDKAVQLERAERMRRFLAQRAHANVMLHEIGHSIGHRHNFVSSSDAWGFRPQYWQLRTDNGTVRSVCQPGNTDGTSCVGPRYNDPITENERTNLLPMFMQSSIMDYAGEATQDMLGLGVYDFAATRMFYGDVVAVFRDADYKAGSAKGIGMVQKMDNFGGIIGIRPSIGNPVNKKVNFFHYSQLQNRYKLINNCEDIKDIEAFRPATWNTERDGEWHPLLDGLIVKVRGKYTRCEQPAVDYVAWEDLRTPEGGTDIDAGWVGRDQGPSIDKQNRVRVPYGFATDSWADTGNLSVFRHDNGADPYELFDFFIAQQEMNHIFDMYRRGKSTFSVRGAAGRNLGRFNEKMRDAAKGLGLYANIYREYSYQDGYDFNTFWPLLVNSFPENAFAAGIAFDHFTRMLARPQAGPHLFAERPGDFQNAPTIPEEDGILRSRDDFFGNDEVENAVLMPNGASGRFGNISFGGKLLENRLAEDKGEYRSSYTVSAGSYYEKAFTAMLMAESADNFISSSRGDFLDARYRSVSMADIFPDAYRRWLANNLTGDDFIKGVRLAADSEGKPLVNKELYPSGTIGWTTWLPKDGPETCFAGVHNYDCSSDITDTVTVDPQVGWEQQKFLIAFTLQYLPENQKQEWLNQLWVWEMGMDSDPRFQNRIEFHDPHGRVYVAKTFGTETVFGKTVQKGIAARILQHANELLQQAYVTTEVTNTAGVVVGYEPVLDADGRPIVKYDPRIRWLEGDMKNPGCYYESETDFDYSACTCESNRACMDLAKYSEVPFFLREAIGAYGLGAPGMKGFY